MMLKLYKELSPADRCRKNNWYPGCVLKAKSVYQGSLDEYWQITAIGRYEVLGIQVGLPPKTTSGECVMKFDDPEFTWRIKERS
jgi:hypothetical protein